MEEALYFLENTDELLFAEGQQSVKQLYTQINQFTTSFIDVDSLNSVSPRVNEIPSPILVGVFFTFLAMGFASHLYIMIGPLHFWAEGNSVMITSTT